MRYIIDACRNWVWQVDRDCCFCFSSHASLDIIGLDPDALVGRSYFSLFPRDESEDITALFRDCVSGGRPIERLIHKAERPDGRIVTLEISGAPTRGEDGTPNGYCGVCRDITDEINLKVRAQVERFCAQAPIALCLVDREGRYTQVNEEFARLCDMAPTQVIGRHVTEFSTEAAQNFLRDIEVFDAGGLVPDHDLSWRGHIFQISTKAVRNAEGKTVGCAVAFTDITTHKRAVKVLTAANERLQAYAERDFLTGLLNRRQFEEVYRIEVSAARREQAPVSLLIADVDQFKAYNDRYGHPAGDECLRQVAKTFAHAMSRPRDVVCRYGGEEFIAILPNTTPDGAMVVAERARKAVWNLEIPHEQGSLRRISISIGVATLLRIDPTLDMSSRRRMLLEAADTALYEAKNAGRNTVRATPTAIES